MRSTGTATVARTSDDPGVFAIRDIAIGGARLVGTTRLGEGEHVRVTLDLDGSIANVEAVVTRVDAQNQQTAIAFRSVSDDAARVIENAIDKLIRDGAAGSAPCVLVLHRDPDVRDALERDLSRLQRAAKPCATLLETMWALQHAPRGIVAIVASDQPRGQLAALLEHLSQHHPKLRRVLLFGDQLEPVAREVSSHVHAVLRTPWRIRALARALGINSADSSLAMLPASEDD